MAKKAPRVPPPDEPREDPLSPDLIVEAAIELLDEHGEEGLTFRALAQHLATGAGALYWHIANKSELLVTATDTIVIRTLDTVRLSTKPREVIHRIALAIFDAIDEHPWVGTQLSRAPWETAMLRIFEHIGREVERTGVRGHAQFTVTSTLVSYVLGVSVQNAAASGFARRELPATTSRTEFLKAAAERWKKLDAVQYRFARKVAAHLPGHDDRKEFLAGIDLILRGLGT